MKSFIVCVFAFAFVSVLGCSAQVTVEEQGTGSAGGNTTMTPTDPVITTGTLPPVHEAGQVIVTDENGKYLFPEGQAPLGTENLLVFAYAVESIGNDAHFERNEVWFDPTDGGSAVSLGGAPYFTDWKLVELTEPDAGDPYAIGTIDDSGLPAIEGSSLRVQFNADLFVPEGTKRFIGVVMDVGKLPSEDDKQYLVDRSFQVMKTPYVEGEIFDGNELVTPIGEVAEDAPMYGIALLVVQ